MKKARKENQDVPVGVKALAYLDFGKKIKKLTEEQKELKVDLKEHVDEFGKENTKGHIFSTVEHAGVEIELKKECRVYRNMVPEAIDILRDKLSKKDFERVVETVQVIHESAVEVLAGSGEIDSRLLASLYEVTNNYAFKIKKV